MQTNKSDNRSSTRALTVAAGHPFFENSEKIQRCLSEASSLDFRIEKIAGRRTVQG